MHCQKYSILEFFICALIHLNLLKMDNRNIIVWFFVVFFQRLRVVSFNSTGSTALVVAHDVLLSMVTKKCLILTPKHAQLPKTFSHALPLYS